jgi:hypothetical protein
LTAVLLDQTKGQLEFKAARDLLELEHKPCQSILAVEFFENTAGSLEKLKERKLGIRTLILSLLLRPTGFGLSGRLAFPF